MNIVIPVEPIGAFSGSHQIPILAQLYSVGISILVDCNPGAVLRGSVEASINGMLNLFHVGTLIYELPSNTPT